MADWHPEDIKAAIRKAGGTLSEIARRVGVPKQTMSACLSARVSDRGDRAIANFIGVKPHDIWPSRYLANGERIRLRAQSVRERAAA